MKEIKNIINTYYIINILYGMGIAVFSATIYLYMQSLHYSYAEINTFLSIFWIVSFLTETPSGIIADTFGRKNAMIGSCVIRSIGLLFLFLDWGNIAFLILGAIFTAIGESLKSSTLDSWMIDSISDIDEKFTFDKIFSMNSMAGTTVNLVSGYFGAQVLGNMDLSYPILAGIILLMSSMVIVIFKMKEPKRNLEEKSHSTSIGRSFNMLKETTKEGICFLRNDKTFFLICLSFLPLSFIVSGPGNQWQLFFQNGTKDVKTGYIWIGLNLCSILGAYLSGKISSLSENKIYILIGSTVLNTLSIIVCVLTDNYLLALLLFLLHVVITASEEVIRYTFLNQNIKNENRSSLLSFFNTLEAGTTILALLLNGFFSDSYGIGNAWLIMSIISLVISIPVYLIVNSTIKKHKLDKSNKVMKTI
jgi:MFS family permease